MINKQRAKAEAEQSNDDKNHCQGSRHVLNVITKSNVCERVRNYVCVCLHGSRQIERIFIPFYVLCLIDWN